jgi:hypothetical protein
MGARELKSDLRKILVMIENEQLLRTIHKFLEHRRAHRRGRFGRL